MASLPIRHRIPQSYFILMLQLVDRSYDEVESYNVRTQAAFDLATKTWNDAKDSHDALSGPFPSTSFSPFCSLFCRFSASFSSVLSASLQISTAKLSRVARRRRKR